MPVLWLVRPPEGPLHCPGTGLQVLHGDLQELLCLQAAGPPESATGTVRLWNIPDPILLNPTLRHPAQFGVKPGVRTHDLL